MHAVLLTVRTEGDLDEATKSLQEQVVPVVRAQPGFVAGYWFEARDGKNHSVVLFQTEEQARAAAPPPRRTLSSGSPLNDGPSVGDRSGRSSRG
jgi:hypothetical protein